MPGASLRNRAGHARQMTHAIQFFKTAFIKGHLDRGFK
jgi:hypothetical protein